MELAEFLQRYDAATFEWIDGEEIHIHEMPIGLERMLRRLAGYLSDYAEVSDGSAVFVHHPFVLLDADEIIYARTPDVMLYHPGQITQAANGLITAAPDLAVEIISTPNEIPAMYRKTLGYLRMGVQQVWLIDPEMHTLSIYRQGTKEITVLGTRHKMQDNALLPGLEFNIVDLFA